MRNSVECLVCVALTALASIDPAAAQERVHHAQSGRPIAIGAFFNCGPRMAPQAPSGTARNGTVTTRLTTEARCGNSNHPVIQVIYTSRPGFRGQDEIFLYGPPAERRRIIVR
jgi:hypothetical protein